MENKPLPQFIKDQIPSGIESKYIDVDGFSIHYLEKGKGIPVFMMHGNPTWSFLYRNIMNELDPEIYHCIAPDLPGLGFSSKPDSPNFHTLGNHQNIITSFLNKVIDQDFIFVGQDWGGPIGLLASMNNKFKMKGMVLLNTMIRPPKKDFKPTLFHSFSRIPLLSDVVFRVAGFPQKYLGMVQGDKKSIKGEVSKAYSWPLKDLNSNQAPLLLSRMVPNNHDHPSVKYLKMTEEFASAYTGPVSIFWGKKDPVLGRLSSAHHNLMPHAKLTITDGGHFIQEEYPKLIAEEIKSLKI
ncbi:alpha/beta fold hydrolase [Marinigracilibium pacificum]|uniref:Alpha/beta fold hydrolase n=1 Tax=Marinigracilibium pacificum TaxID=2729599 RepID=A0A848IUF1_9BACT|nr:alpha/beta fold hydrolase [Marinigracilibium pacificum]NMM48133.1 alpha/beta fold hydrolase [Marinigracilibium pacificum]